MNREALLPIVKEQLKNTIERTNLSGIGRREEGKVRDCYVGTDRRAIVVTDRLSAFDMIIGTIPFKGQVLNQIAAYWFEETKGIAKNHVLSIPDPNVMIGRECTPLNGEFVMRAYLTGVTSTSIWRAYERGDRTFCGHALPEGMKKNEQLPGAILTPSTKAPKGDHDISVSGKQLVDMGMVTQADFDQAADIVTRLFAFGQKRAAERGLILVDTKYELGKTPDGEIVVIDEIHTPDSSRYWYSESYASRLKEGREPGSLDKEYVRRWLSEERGYTGDGPPPPLPDDVRAEAAMRYISIYELVTGKAFEPDTRDAESRIAKSMEGLK